MKKALLRLAWKLGYQRNLMRVEVIAPRGSAELSYDLVVKEFDRLAAARGMALCEETICSRGRVKVSGQVEANVRGGRVDGVFADRFEAKAKKIREVK